MGKDKKYTAAFFDVDGTLVDSNRRFSVHTVRALNLMRKSNFHRSLATGRSWRSALPYIQAVDCDLPVVLFNGAAIYDPETSECLLRMPLPAELALPAMELAQKLGLEVNLYIGDELFVEDLSDVEYAFWKKDGLRPIPAGDLCSHLERHGEDPVKLLCIGRPDVCAAFESEMAESKSPAHVVRSEPDYVEVLAPGVNKGLAIKLAAEMAGIDLSSVVAFGDGPNDREMLKIAGLGVAPQNARKEAKDAADVVIGPNDSDDLGFKLMELFCLEERR